MMTGAITYTIDPFPGLRPFEPENSALFFGREEQTDELLRRLERARFLAVVGDSGSGKSSLVRAGLMPALQRGYMAEAGSRWEIALFRPGDDPVGNLARALYRSGKAGDGSDDAQQIQKILERNSMGLAQAATVILPPRSNLLVVVDQFEEIFRYKRETQKRDGGDSAAAFVKLLLNASQEETSVVNVVLTMRSDFLGECSQFRGLPEALNGGQYLVPRLSREQMKEVIEGPAAVAGAEFAPMLVQRLLNDVGDNPDQLPVLQHALMRTWEQSAASRDRGEPISLSHYEAMGGIAQALNRHVESAYQELSEENREIAKKIFQRLTERAKGGRDIRRPTKVGELCAVAGVDEERVIAVINKFREAGRTFLTSPDAASLTNGSIIDVTHESLIRLWDTLHEWVAEEMDSAHLYRRLAESAVEGRAAYHDQDLKQALAWRQATSPNQAWAGRYHSAFDQAMEFLDRSWKLDRARNRKKAAAIAALCISTLVAAGFSVKTYFQKQELGARELLAEAQGRDSMQGPALERSALLAIESVNRFRVSSLLPKNKSFESESVLREDMALLPRPIATLQNDSNVQALAFSPDGKLVATGTQDGAVRVFEAFSGKDPVYINGQTTVLSLVFSPDGHALAVGNWAGAKIFDPSTGKQLVVLNDDQEPVYSIAFSPDGRYIATGSSDATAPARVFEAHTGRELWASSEGGIVNVVAFSPDGQKIATASSDGARILAAATGKQMAFFPHPVQVTAIAFSPDGSLLATGGGSKQDLKKLGIARVYDLKTGKESAHVLHHGRVNAVAFSPDGTRVVSGSQDGVALVFSVKDGSDFSHFDHDDAVTAVQFSKDGHWVATASSDHTGVLFEASTGKEIMRLIHADKVRAVAFSPDGNIVATAGDHTARLFPVRNGNATARLLYNSRVLFAVFSPNGKLLASVTEKGNVHIVQADSGKEIQKLPSGVRVNKVVFSPDEKLVAVGAEDGSTTVYEAATRRVVSRGDDIFPVESVAFSPDSALVASGHLDGVLRVFEAQGGKEIRRLTLGSRSLLPSDAIWDIKFSPDGAQIITGSKNPAANTFSGQVIDIATGRELAHHEHQDQVRAVAVAPRGRLAMSASYDGTAVLLDLSKSTLYEAEGGSKRRELDRFTDLGRVNAVAFSHDGTMVAIGSEKPDGSGITKVFETASSKQLAVRPQNQPVKNVIFSPDDRWVAASDGQVIEVFHAIDDAARIAKIKTDHIKDIRFTEDGVALQVLSAEDRGPGEPDSVSIERHLLRTQDLINEGCSRLTRNLTSGDSGEWERYFLKQTYRPTCPQLK